MDERPAPDIAHGVPPLPVSNISTRVNRTGSWKYIRPAYRDKVAPCNQGCPVGIDVEGYLNLLRESRFEEARDLLLSENPMPAVTGRVCHHPCEVACNRRQLDQAVAVHAVERAMGDWALEHPVAPLAVGRRRESVGVVGSGPAGLACAYHLTRLGYRVTVYEAEGEPGGVLRYGIPAYRLPREVVAGEIERIRSLGVEIRCGVRLGKTVPWGTLDRHDAVFLATGAHRGRPLGLEGEPVAGIVSGLAFLRAVNGGEHPRLGRRVVVVGGGNTAMDCARTALRLGAEVTVLYRRTRDEMPAHPDEVEEALREGVDFRFLAAPVAVRTTEQVADEPALEAIEAMFGPAQAPAPRLAGLECMRMRLGEPDADGRRRPIAVEGERFILPADTVLTAIGEDADLDALPDGLSGADGALAVDALNTTTCPTIFAGGDLVAQPRTVADALGAGKRAAIGIDRMLGARAGDADGRPDPSELRWGGSGNLSITRWRGDDPVPRTGAVNEVVRWEEMNPAHYRKRPRHGDRHLAPAGTSAGFAESNLGLSRIQAMAEARRCLNCGVCNTCELCLIFCPDLAIARRADGPGFVIDYDHCKGCGVCAAECPRGAITMTREGL
jgi:2-oxoacid:acceptor oxidoreductase delta subunit (pyruvate/2-ketoisovalerate family)